MRFVLTNQNLGKWAADYVVEKINNFAPTANKKFVLGLPTGGTVVDMYACLCEANREGKVSFRHVVTFNMDEYVAIAKTHPESYYAYMHRNLFDHIDINPKNVHILNGNAANLEGECAAYETAIRHSGGIQLFLGGVGRNGHLAFNEPGTPFSSRTHRVALTKSTIEANARFFEGDLSQVPTEALTVGIGTVCDAKEVLILVQGEKKADAMRRLLEETPTENCPITALRHHPNATILVDEGACKDLSPATKEKLRALKEADPNKGYWMLEI